MKLNALLREYFNQKEKHEKKVGRYSATSLYEIITGRLKPEDFLKEKKFDLTSCKNMFEGEIREMALKILLDASEITYVYQMKKVEKFKEFEIVCVADFIFPDYILECKSPREFSGIKDYHRPQLECQHRLFDKDVYVIYLKERMESLAYKYVPSQKLWDTILEKVKGFDKKLKEL